MGFIQFYPSWGRIVVVIIAMNAVQMVVGNFLDPKLSGEHLNLSPFIILVSLVFWGWLWGIIGLFLAVPLTVIIKIICENIPYLKPVSIFMESGKKYK
jgi:predicted PurR-regulated permease PerM